MVLQQLQKMEDTYRAEHPSWMDEEVAPADIPKQWQEARANRQMQFKVGRGMGSPMPSLEEGAWTREGPKFVDGGH